MDYKKILTDTLLSDDNINYMVKMVLDNYKINKKVSDKCASFIKSRLRIYSDKLERYPEDKNELTQALAFLNKKCYEDFEKYLEEKYPGVNLRRNDTKSATVVSEKIPEENMIILNEREAQELILKSSKNGINDDFLRYMSDTAVIQSFCDILCHMNHLSQIKNIKIDEILTEEQAMKIIEDSKNGIEYQPKEQCIQQKTSEESSIEFPGDLSCIDNNMLLSIKEHIDKLNALKEKCIGDDNQEKAHLIESEQKKLIGAVSEYRNEMAKKERESMEKIETLKIVKTTNEDYDDLDLEIDPINNYEEMKKIAIKLNSPDNKKLSEIILVKYDIHFNEDNITRFNNTFVISHNDNIDKFFIPTGNYEIHALLQLIESKVQYLKFSVFNEKITIVSKYDLPFDLDIGVDSLFTSLGFVGNASDYKGEKEYTAAKKYDLNSNKKVFFSIGMSSEPLELSFDNDKEVNKVIKKFRGSGATCNQIKLSFTNSLEQCYDFIKPIKIHLRFKWV